MFLGNKFRAKRISLNLTQSQIADEICTQFTISNLENKNIAPSTDILVPLCKRLGLTLNELFSEFSSIQSPIMNFDQMTLAEQSLLMGNSKLAKNLIQDINFENTDPKFPVIFYLWRGYISFLNDEDYDSSIFYLTQYSQSTEYKDNYSRLLFDVILGEIYDHAGNQELSKFYFKKSSDCILKQKDIEKSQLYILLFSIVTTSQFYIKTKKINLAKKLLDLGINYAQSNLITYFMDQMFSLLLSITGTQDTNYEFIRSASYTFARLTK